VYAFNALLADYPADRLHTGREIAPNDIAVFFPTETTTGTPGLVPLTHGNLLYAAWALGLVTTLAPGEVLLRGLARFFQGWCWPADGSWAAWVALRRIGRAERFAPVSLTE
jgi:fatty-acyl-CoA synthase